jgi:hypothetical protein
MFGFSLPPNANVEIKEDDIPALGRLRATINVAEGYSVVKTLLTDDGNLFVLLRKSGALDTIWWHKRNPDDTYSLYLDVPVVTAAAGYGAISDFDYLRASSFSGAMLAVGYPDCPKLRLNDRSTAIRDASRILGAVTVYRIVDNYGPATLISAAHDATVSNIGGGIDAFVDVCLLNNLLSYCNLSDAKIGYTVKFLVLNSTAEATRVYVATGMPYKRYFSTLSGGVTCFEVNSSGELQYFHDTSNTFIVGFNDGAITGVIGTGLIMGDPNSLYPVTWRSSASNMGLHLSTNATMDTSSTDTLFLATSGTSNAVAVNFSSANNTGTGYGYEFISMPPPGVASNVCVSSNYLAVANTTYSGTTQPTIIHVYSWNGTAWGALQTFGPPYDSPSTFGNFAASMTMSKDGGLLLVAEPNRHTYGNEGKTSIRYLQAGGVHVYEKVSTYGADGNPYWYVYVQTVYPKVMANNMKFGSTFSVAPSSTKLDSAAAANNVSPSVNVLAVVGSSPTEVSIFTAGGFNGHVANDD